MDVKVIVHWVFSQHETARSTTSYSKWFFLGKIVSKLTVWSWEWEKRSKVSETLKRHNTQTVPKPISYGESVYYESRKLKQMTNSQWCQIYVNMKYIRGHKSQPVLERFSILQKSATKWQAPENSFWSTKAGWVGMISHR